MAKKRRKKGRRKKRFSSRGSYMGHKAPKRKRGRRKKARRSGGHIPLKILERRAGKLLRIVHKRGGSPV